jgi:uncharacterized protein (DUF362 family)
MSKSVVAIVRYEKPGESVRRAVEFCGGLDHLPENSKVFIKPNIVFWTRVVPFPKWGMITTSRVLEDMVALLKERGVENITIGEGMVVKPRDRKTPAHAFETLGYNLLKRRYGVKCVNVFERPFEEVDLGADVVLNFNQDFLKSDFVVDLPVLKTHASTIISLGIKNLKGLIDIPSRRRCHSAEPGRDLHYYVSRLANKLPASMTLIDGIYSMERGPGYDGKARRSNLLVASRDVLSADLVGAKVLGYDPVQVPYLVYAAKDKGRPVDLSDVDVVGEKIEEVSAKHESEFSYSEDGNLPESMAKMGIKGLAYPKYDLTICTFCAMQTAVILRAIALAWQGKPWDDVEILTGKIMKPSPGKKTILLGKCMCEANKEHPNFKEMIPVKGCPPSPRSIVKALQQAGINVDPGILENIDKAPEYQLKRYKDKPGFEEGLFSIS